MKVFNAFAAFAVFALVSMACAQAQPAETDPPSLSAKWVSAIVGLKVTTPAGDYLGRVKDVVVDGYGRSTYAIISYGGMMGLARKYTAVPWATVAEMLERDRLIVDRSQLENAPILVGAKPDSSNTRWRHAADSYWRSMVATAASDSDPAVSDTSAAPPPAERPVKERN